MVQEIIPAGGHETVELLLFISDVYRVVSYSNVSNRIVAYCIASYRIVSSHCIASYQCPPQCGHLCDWEAAEVIQDSLTGPTAAFSVTSDTTQYIFFT